jgi:D-2-hydroxyacid dehydrogenase (NADP+)
MIVSLLIWEPPCIPAIEEAVGEKITQCRTKEAAMQALPEADIVILMGGGGLLLDAEMLSVSKKLKLVLSVSAGMEKLPMRLLHERNIAVCNTKGVHAGTIAEYVVGGMLAISHHFPAFIRNQDKAEWTPVFSFDDIGGQTLCVIGAGAIGSEIGKKAKAMDMKVIGLKRHPEPIAHFDAVWGIDRLHEALSLADFAVLITPLTKETYHLMGAAEFSIMKSTAVFINVSRGDTADEAALIGALREKRIAAALLDVFHTEPLAKDSPLWTMDNVLITPHNAALSANSDRKLTRTLCDNINRLRRGQELINQVKKGEMY